MGRSGFSYQRTSRLRHVRPAKHAKYNFFDGAALADPDIVFNSGLGSKRSRSIDLTENATVDANALDCLITAAFAAADTPSKKGR